MPTIRRRRGFDSIASPVDGGAYRIFPMGAGPYGGYPDVLGRCDPVPGETDVHSFVSRRIDRR
jgi:hypothetical protein